MPFTTAGSDVVMARNPATGRLDFDWDATGNPRYADDNVHRVLSLLMEHRPSPPTPRSEGGPGWWADTTGRRGSLLYTFRNVLRTTPSEIEAAVVDALRKAEDEGWITDVSAKAFLSPRTRARVEVRWKNPGAQPALVALSLAT